MASHFAHLLPRADTCETGNDYNGRMGLRISSIFVILIGSLIGATFPVFAARHRGVGVPSWAFFIAKFFGSGVIVATAFIHLLAPANEALTNACLSGPITEYSWVEGIVLMTIFSMFFVELMVMRYAKFGTHSHDHDEEEGHHSHSHSHTHDKLQPTSSDSEEPKAPRLSSSQPHQISHIPGEDHLGHANEHTDIEDAQETYSAEDYASQLTAIFILEFGVIFHSVFIGLTLAVSGPEFITLYIVLVFHQTFEGLGLGSRLAATPWPKARRWTPYWLGIGYALSTPIAIAVGLGIRKTFNPNSATTLITNGIFDSISAGILIYTGLVELMAHEFMFSNAMRKAPIKTVLAAFGTMCAGSGLMALLGEWA